MRAIQDLEQMGYVFILSDDVLNYAHSNGGVSDPDRARALLGYVKRHKAEAVGFLQERLEIETRLEDHLAVMAAATGCSDETAEELLSEWDRLNVLYAQVMGSVPEYAGTYRENGQGREREALEAEVLEHWSGDPPPLEPCGVGGTHRKWWRRPSDWGGGWVCAACHPSPPGVEVEVWEIPKAETDRVDSEQM